MRIENLNDLFVEQLKDLYNAEQQVEKAYQRWQSAAEDEALADLIGQHRTYASQHRQHIAAICGGLDVSPEGEMCHGMKGLITEGDELLDEVADGAVKDAGLIAMAQRVEHYGITGYGCARTYALHLGYDDAAERLQHILDEQAKLDDLLTGLAEEVLNAEAAEEPVAA